MVLKTTGSEMSVRGVATWLSARTSTDLRLRGRQPERRLTAGGRRRAELDPDQFEELDVVEVGNPVETVDELINHLGHRLDQRHAGVGDVVVGPGRAALLHKSLGVIDEILEVSGRRGWVRAACLETSLQENRPGRSGGPRPAGPLGAARR